MGVKNVMYLANLAANTERGPSEAIWGKPGTPNAWVEDFIQDPRLGIHTYEEFDLGPNFAGGSFTGSAGRWAIFSTANGAFADDAIVGGGLRLKASTTINQGVTLGSVTTGYRIVDGSANLQGQLALEFRARVSVGSFVASTQDTFVGFMDLTPASQTPITNTGGTLASSMNFIGFHKRGGATNPGDWNFVYGASGQTIQYPTNLQALFTNASTLVNASGVAPSENVYYKLGFVFDPTPANIPLAITKTASTLQTVAQVARPMIRVYVNGVPMAAFIITGDITAATFPSAVMGPVIAFMQQSTTAGIYTAFDWFRSAQVLLA